MALKFLEKCKQYHIGIFNSNQEPSYSPSKHSLLQNTALRVLAQATHGIHDRAGNSVKSVLSPSNVGALKHPQVCVCTPLTCRLQGRPGLGAFCPESHHCCWQRTQRRDDERLVFIFCAPQRAKNQLSVRLLYHMYNYTGISRQTTDLP